MRGSPTRVNTSTYRHEVLKHALSTFNAFDPARKYTSLEHCKASHTRPVSERAISTLHAPAPAGGSTGRVPATGCPLSRADYAGEGIHKRKGRSELPVNVKNPSSPSP
jgi:hypothetical protein